MRFLVILCLFAPFLSAADNTTVAEHPHRADHVIILVIDGPRWSETWGEAKRAYIPRRAQDLAPQGTMLTRFSNDGPTYTNAGHTALTTGFYQEIDNSGKELPRHPGLFQLHLKATKAAATDAWIITSKDKLKVLADCTDQEWHGRFSASTDCGKGGTGPGYRDDAETMRRVREVLVQHHPHLMLINFKEPDSSGHSKDWQRYLAGIRSTDAYAGELWKLLQADPVYAGHTALFITNDHGRHLDGIKEGFAEHGDDCAGCRHIELLALGPDFAPGAVDDHAHGQIDLAETAAMLLGIELPGGTGHVMDDLLAAPAAK